MRSVRVFSGAVSFTVAVLVAGAMAMAQTPIANCGFNSTEETPSYFTIGDLNGQGGSANGWAGPWVSTSGKYLVVAGGSPASATCASDSPGDPDQHLQMFGSLSSGYTAQRPMTDWSGDFVLQFDAKLTLAATGHVVATEQIQLEDTADPAVTGKRPLNVKWEADGRFRLNDQDMLLYAGNANFKSMLGNWVTVKIICDWETQTFDLYWTNATDGCLSKVGTKVGWKDSTFTGIVRKLRIDAPKVTIATDGLEIDRITFVTAPPPGPCDTVVLLNSGAERFTVVTGNNPSPIGYTLHNGGNTSHDYNVDEMQAVAHSITGLFNTGVDASGTPLGDQVLDPHYTLTTNPDSAGSETYTSLDDGFPIPPWIGNTATSRWITVRSDDGDSFGNPGDYIYRTTFTPPGIDTTVYGLVATDDALEDLLVNGRSTGISSGIGFESWKLFQLDLTATDDTLDFQVGNGGSTANPTGLRAEFFNLSQHDYPWLSVAPINPITVPTQTSAAVTATINTADLPAGVYTAYLRFRNLDDCDPPNNSFEEPVIRRIEMTVTNWEVTPDGASLDVPLGANCPGHTPDDVEFTVANLGAAGDVTYTVAKMGECNWLTLDKAGPIVVGPGLTDVVTATVDPTGLAAGTYTCSLVFTNEGTLLPKEIRTVTLHVVGTVWEYKGDVNPLDPDSAGPGLNFIIHSEYPMPVSQGQVEDDPLATDGKVWRLADSDTAKTKFRSQPNTGVSGQLGATIVARMRVYSYGPNTAQGLAFGIWDDVTGDSAEIFYSGDEGAGTGTLKELRRGQSATVTGDNQFHVIRLTVEGTVTLDRVINVYFDENPTPVLSITSASNSTTTIDGFVFGAGSTGGQIDVAFDWLTATDAGAFAPGEEVDCLGRSLVLDDCPTPFADADEDGDVDQSDFAAFQACYTGSPASGSIPENCRCFNRHGGDDDVDELDLQEFEKCATGPGISWTEELAPNCNP